MEDVEQRALASVPVSLSFWKRFVNDVISAVSSNEIDILLQHLNSIEPSIQFTVEREQWRNGGRGGPSAYLVWGPLLIVDIV
jgi:hypothetical protein